MRGVKGGAFVKTVFSKHHGIFCLSQPYLSENSSNFLRQSPQFNYNQCEIIVSNDARLNDSVLTNWLPLDGELPQTYLKNS